MAATALEDLARACGIIEKLDFKAENRDEATDAFEAFRKAVTRVMRFEDSQDRDVLANLEPKAQLTEFLLDLSARYAIYRSRVAEAFRALHKSDSWAAAVQANMQHCAAIQGLLHEGEAVGKVPHSRHLSSDDLEHANASSQLPHLLASMGGSRRAASDPWSVPNDMSQVWGVPPKPVLGPQTFSSSWPDAGDDRMSNPFKVNAANNSFKRVANWNAYVIASSRAPAARETDSRL